MPQLPAIQQFSALQSLRAGEAARKSAIQEQQLQGLSQIGQGLQNGQSLQELAAIAAQTGNQAGFNALMQLAQGQQDFNLRERQVGINEQNANRLNDPSFELSQRQSVLDYLRTQGQALDPREEQLYLATGQIRTGNGSIRTQTIDTVDESGNPVKQIVRTDDGSFSPVATFPAQSPASAGNASRAQAEQQRQAERSADIVIQEVDRATQLIQANPNISVGLGGALSENIPQTPAHDLQALIETIKANAGFDKLQQLRRASPTGGALGPVSDHENRLLQAAIGNLKVSQSRRQLLDNLQRVRDIYSDIIHVGNIARGVQPNSSGGGSVLEKSGGSAQSTAPAIGTILDGYRYNGGDPANPQSWELVQ